MLNKRNISANKQRTAVYIFLVVITLAVFWQVNHFDFVNLDDQIYVEENSHIQSGITLDGFCWAFSTTYAEFWHPLTWLSLMLDYQFHDLNACGYHLTNLILHILSTLLLFWLFNRMTGAISKSAFVAALFALHPLHVESVAWIAERKDVLSAFFWMLTLCLYVYYTEKPVIRRYLLVLFFFTCALMSKPMVVTLPLIMILLDCWPLERFESHKSNWVLWQLKEKTPFFVLSGVFSIITFYAHYTSFEKHFSFSLDSRIVNAIVSFATYLEKTFWPYDMAAFYPFPSQIPAWQFIGSSLLIIIISVAVIATKKRLPYFFVGWLWYAITLFPVIGIIQVGHFAMADRYTYLPLTGIGIMLAWGIGLLFPREDTRKKILFPAGITILAILAILTWKQCGYWKNSFELFNHALRVTKDNYIAHHGLGLALIAEGKTKEAINQYNKTIIIEPEFSSAYNNRGIVYGGLGQYQLAMDDFNKAIRLKENYAEAYYNKAITYASLGQYQLAVEDYNKAISINPDYAYAFNNRGAIYFKQGNNKLGCLDAQKGCALGKCKVLEWAKGNGLCR
jgi:protein O-mannosyl-transferase